MSVNINCVVYVDLVDSEPFRNF